MSDILDDIKAHVDDGMSIRTASLLEDAAQEIAALRREIKRLCQGEEEA